MQKVISNFMPTLNDLLSVLLLKLLTLIPHIYIFLAHLNKKVLKNNELQYAQWNCLLSQIY